MSRYSDQFFVGYKSQQFQPDATMSWQRRLNDKTGTQLPGIQLTMATSADLVALCTPSTFATPDLASASFTTILAEPVQDFTEYVTDVYYFNNPAVQLTNATFCNITSIYTHPGEGDVITVTTLLPISSPAWNGRLQAVGGGGFSAGGEGLYITSAAMLGAIGQGYATVTTNAGVNELGDATSWALLSEGNVNMYLLQNLGSVSLYDEKVIVDSYIESFYGEPASYSYWSGCSQGGRQGMMLAQRYPDLYDGIAASAPAFWWGQFVAAEVWPELYVQLFLNGTQPLACELDEITSLAVATCDSLDGVTDGVISDPDVCAEHMNVLDFVGTTFNCSTTGEIISLSEGAALFANITWEGPRAPNGSFMWYGPQIGSELTTSASEVSGNALLGAEWLNLFVAKNSSFDIFSASYEEFYWLFRLGIEEFDSIIGTAVADLSEFKRLGGKMLSYHGGVSFISILSSLHLY